MDALMAENMGKAGELLVLDGLKHCVTCVKVYPSMVKLTRSMADSAVFACMNLEDMEVVEVPKNNTNV